MPHDLSHVCDHETGVYLEHRRMDVDRAHMPHHLSHVCDHVIGVYLEHRCMEVDRAHIRGGGGGPQPALRPHHPGPA